jgi:hypothetical protein
MPVNSVPPGPAHAAGSQIRNREVGVYGGPSVAPQRHAATFAAVAVAVIGAVVCGLWLLGAPEATRLVPASSTVRFTTGLSFLSAGTGLWLVLGARPRWAMAAVAPALLLAGATLVEYATGLGIGIGQLSIGGRADPGAGRMAPNTALALVVAGVALAALVPGRTRIWALSIAAMLATLTASLGLVAVLGYAFDLTAAFAWAG